MISRGFDAIGTTYARRREIGERDRSTRSGRRYRGDRVSASFVFIQKPVDELGGDDGSVRLEGEHGNAAAVIDGEGFWLERLPEEAGDDIAGRGLPLTGNLLDGKEDEERPLGRRRRRDGRHRWAKCARGGLGFRRGDGSRGGAGASREKTTRGIWSLSVVMTIGGAGIVSWGMSAGVYYCNQPWYESGFS